MRSVGVAIGGRGGSHLEIEFVDRAIQPVQELEAVIPAAASVGQKSQGLQLGQSLARPPRGSEGETLIQRDGVQTVVDHRPDADESEPVCEERGQIARRRIRNPDKGEAVVLQEPPTGPGVEPIGLGLAPDHRANLRGLADHEGVPQARQECVEPQRGAGAFDADGHGWRPRGIEAFDGVAVVGQRSFPELARVRVQQRDLLLPRVQVTSDQNHESALRWCDVVVLGSTEATSHVWLFS